MLRRYSPRARARAGHAGRRTAAMNRAGVRIADYAEPEFTAEGRAIVDGIASLAGDVVLEPGALLRDACAQTGLDDFGDDDFLERLHVYVDALEHEAHLSATGRVMTYGMLLQLLRNRLLVEATVQRNPEILDVDIAQ